MNIVQKIQNLNRFTHFEEWYKKNYFWESYQEHSFRAFCSKPFEFQKGVFEKYLNSCGYVVYNETVIDYDAFDGNFDAEKFIKNNFSFKICFSINDRLQLGNHPMLEDKYIKTFDSFEELLIWLFNLS